jgi:uncharacterized protein (TIRG00374 family)
VKLAINIGLSLLCLAVCLWLVWPNAHNRAQLEAVMGSIDLATYWPTVAEYVGLLALTHFLRAWRWNNLLRPIGVTLPPARLLAISSVGFMAILALPARLGELVRPALLRKRGHVSASAVLGTVAVERIVDGLIVSLVVFACCLAIHLRGAPDEPGWMMPTAYASLAVFSAAIVFLAFALRRPEATTRFALRVSLLDRLAPQLAEKISAKLLEMIRGFLVLDDRRNLAAFVAWSVLYWAVNGAAMLVLARGLGLDVSYIAVLATMGIVAVGITMPNSPGLVGQFHWFTVLGLSLYLPRETAETSGLAYAILLHGISTIWYVAVGALAMFTSHVKLSELVERGPGVDTPLLSKETA